MLINIYFLGEAQNALKKREENELAIALYD